MRFFAKTLILPAVLAAAPAIAQDAEPFTGPSVVAVAGVDHASGAGVDDTGFLYGGAVTYDLGAGQVRYGVEAEITGSTKGGCESGLVVTGDRSCYNTGRDFYAGGRLGVVVGQNVLLYGKAGYTNARLSGTYNDPATAATPDVRFGDNNDGYRLGAGAEFNAGKFLIRTEYRFSDYSDVAGARHQGVVGLGYRF
ncbi:outer membrane beta-barrel protein [Sphingomonas sp. BT-65]|uniref:outer membrane protein n=1 Tax=Sphingomonas sp. BT-65 TaxID=2989821 RepID=UPI002236C0F2|nr:outer membrane beta-barrel protein [Sphingomonas sp. BT-65]MCW4461828.1 outer membrane beta-barrel protein [Sphingomonas sp. BT-65]